METFTTTTTVTTVVVVVVTVVREGCAPETRNTHGTTTRNTRTYHSGRDGRRRGDHRRRRTCANVRPSDVTRARACVSTTPRTMLWESTTGPTVPVVTAGRSRWRFENSLVRAPWFYSKFPAGEVVERLDRLGHVEKHT